MLVISLQVHDIRGNISVHMRIKSLSLSFFLAHSILLKIELYNSVLASLVLDGGLLVFM